MKKISIILLLSAITCCAPSNKSNVQRILQDEYDFMIVSCNESNLLYFEGINREGEKVHEKIPYFWDISNFYSIGDSIIKRKGEKNIKLVKSDTVIILRFGGQNGPLYPEEQDSIFKILIKWVRNRRDKSEVNPKVWTD